MSFSGTVQKFLLRLEFIPIPKGIIIFCLLFVSLCALSLFYLNKTKSEKICSLDEKLRDALQKKSESDEKYKALQQKHVDDINANHSRNSDFSSVIKRHNELLRQKDDRIHCLEQEIFQLRNSFGNESSSSSSADIKDYKDKLVQRYWNKINQVESRYASQFKSKLELSAIKSFLPESFYPLFSSPLAPDMVSRICSALHDDISLVSPLTCSVSVKGAAGETYQTSLESCTCMDFKYRGAPCKHMLCLLFALIGYPYSELSGYDQIRFSSQALLDLQRKFDQKAKADASVISQLKKEKQALSNEVTQHKDNLKQVLLSHLSSAPWLAGMMADYLTYDLEMKAKYLDWGSDKKRLKKVEDIREIRENAKARIAEAKVSIYQLEYLRQLYPGIDDVLDTDFKDLNFNGTIPEHDPTKDYLSKEEWNSLASAEKDQLALDRYVQTKNKSNWQIGRDYELSVAYEYSCNGYTVDTFGSRKGLEDLGRDIISFKTDHTIITQCKYWSKHKTIHEKHIFQLYGTLITYRIDHPDLLCPVIAVFVTNTTLSDTAREVAKALQIVVVENHEMVDFPRIKCNIGRGESGPTKIYHLPMDSQYDVVQIKDPGEFYSFTVQEAIDAGFRRAYKWHGN